MLFLVALVACSSGRSGRADAGARREVRDAAPAVPEAEPFLQWTGSLALWDDPLPGSGLTFLFGGPPHRRCTFDAESLGGRFRCVEVVGFQTADEPQLSQRVGTRPAKAFSIGGSKVFQGDPAAGCVVATVERADDEEGPLASLQAWEGGYQVFAMSLGREVRATYTKLGKNPQAALVGDRVVWSESGVGRAELHSIRALRGSDAFAPVENLGATPQWSSVERCQSGSRIFAWLHEPVERSGDNGTRVEEPTEASVVLFGEGPTKVVQARLTKAPDSVGCDGESTWATSIRADRRPHPGPRRHEIRMVQCSPAGCSDRSVSLTGVRGWWPAIARAGDEVLLAWQDDRGAVIRMAPLDTLTDAPDRVLIPGATASDSGRSWAIVRPGLVLALFERDGSLFAARIHPDAHIQWVPSFDALPPLENLQPRYGAGGPIRGR